MMTREEAIKFAEHAVNMTDIPDVKEFYRLAAAALRPVSREQVEKVWRGEWVNSECTMLGDVVCGKCGVVFEGYYESYQFCPRCGAPMTDEAVQMVMERLEALKDADD